MEHSVMHDMSWHPSIGATFLPCEAGLLVGELVIRRLVRGKTHSGRRHGHILRCAKREFHSNFGLTI